MLKFVRGSDMFSVPVQLKYKGQPAFNTLCGGCCSILFCLALLTYFIYELHSHAAEPQYKS